MDQTLSNSKECLAIYEDLKKITSCINVYDIYRKPTKECKGTEKKLLKAFGTSEVGGVTKTYRRYFTTKHYSPWLSADHP